MMHRRWISGVALAAALALGGDARAAYNYNVTVSPGSYASGQSSVSIVGQGGVLPILSGVNNLSLAKIGVASTTPTTSSDLINDRYTLLLTISEPGVSSAGTFTIVGALSGQVNQSSSTLDNTYFATSPGQVTVGGDTFQLSLGTLGLPGFYYGPPTINAGLIGSLGGQLISASPPPLAGGDPLPEPRALVLLALGLVGAAGLVARRRVA